MLSEQSDKLAHTSNQTLELVMDMNTELLQKILKTLDNIDASIVDIQDNVSELRQNQERNS